MLRLAHACSGSGSALVYASLRLSMHNPSAGPQTGSFVAFQLNILICSLTLERSSALLGLKSACPIPLKQKRKKHNVKEKLNNRIILSPIEIKAYSWIHFKTLSNS